MFCAFMTLVCFHQLVDPRIPLSLKVPLSGELEAEKSLLLTGQNGSGKTTLIHILVGLVTPHHGQVHTAPFFYCGHQTGLKNTWTVLQNLSFRTQLYGKPYSTLSYLKETLRWFGLHTLAERKVGLLSRGQQQQIALISAFLSPYKVWILDEPFVHLDADARQFWQQMMKQHCQQGGGLICSSPCGEDVFPGDTSLNLTSYK